MGRHIAPNFGESGSWPPPARRAIVTVQVIAFQRLSSSQKACNRLPLRDGPLFLQVGAQTLTAPPSDHTRRDVRKLTVNSPYTDRMIHHLAEGVRVSTQIDLYPFSCEFQVPLEFMSGAIESWGHKDNHMAQSIFTFSRLAPVGSIRPPTMGPLSLRAHFSTNFTARRVSGMR